MVAQVIGNDIPELVRTAKFLQQFPVAAIDLNLGCPAPIVYRKCAGGGLLREPQRIDAILGALRDAVGIKFTVKTRLGFATVDEFDQLLSIFARHSLDALTGARGLMIGRGVIRSPWLFNQIRQQLRGETVTVPTGREVAGYIRALWDSQAGADKPEKVQCERMKKFLNYLGEGVPGSFLHQIRRTQTAVEALA